MAGNAILVLSETVSFTVAVGSGSGERFYVQFNGINSYLQHGKRDANTTPAARWNRQFSVLLVIRNSEGEVRWMEVRDFLKRASNNVKKPVRQIVFEGERRRRDERAPLAGQGIGPEFCVEARRALDGSSRHVQMHTERSKRIPEQLILWRRTDVPGHDACGLWVMESGWCLTGTAIFALEGQPCHLAYEVDCDTTWRTRSAKVTGYIGRHALELTIVAMPGERWQLNGIDQPEAAGCIDVDLNFTPATNLIAIRRLALGVGHASDAPAAWLRFPELHA